MRLDIIQIILGAFIFFLLGYAVGEYNNQPKQTTHTIIKQDEAIERKLLDQETMTIKYMAKFLDCRKELGVRDE